MKQILHHSFPILGRIDVPLHAESALIFEMLSRVPMAGARFWQALDHLGELRTVLKCGHHSRYEYLLLQLYLIHFFKQEAKGFGLSTRVSLPNGTEVSSAEELLKCWALLDEFGHLKGTYEAERFLLHTLCSRQTFGNHFIAAFRDQRAVNFAKQVIGSEDLWNLHRAISWLALETYHGGTKYAEQKGAIAVAIEMLNGLVSPTEDEALLRTRGYFSRIRRLAHIYLDMANLPTYVHFHPTILLQRLSTDPAAFLDDSNNATNRLMSGILDYLQDEMYASPDANKYKLDRIEGLTNSLETSLKTRTNSPASSTKRLSNWILGAKGGEFWGHRTPKLERRHCLRLRLVSDGYFSPDAVKSVTASRKFGNTVQSARWSSIITSYVGPLGHSCFFDLYETDSDGRTSQGLVVRAILEFLQDCYPSHFKLREVYHWLCDERFEDVLKYILGRAIPGPNIFRFDKRQTFSDYAINLVESKSMRLRWSKTAAWQVKKLRMSPERNWEVECLRREIRSSPKGYIMTATVPILVEDANHKCRAEFDGVFIRLNKRLLELTLIEAKHSNKGASADAENSLRDKLIRLGMAKVENHVVRKYKYASVTIRL